MESSVVNAADTLNQMKRFGTAHYVKMIFVVKSATISIILILVVTALSVIWG